MRAKPEQRTQGLTPQSPPQWQKNVWPKTRFIGNHLLPRIFLPALSNRDYCHPAFTKCLRFSVLEWLLPWKPSTLGSLSRAIELRQNSRLLCGSSEKESYENLQHSKFEMWSRFPGIGPKRLKAYGEEICKLVQTYCEQHKIDLAVSPVPMPISAAVNPDSMFRMSATKRQSFDLFRAGKSLAEIATARGVTQSTVEGHLVPYIATGQFDILSLMSQLALTELTQHIVDHPQQTVAEIKSRFGDKYGYSEIKMAIAYEQSQRTSS